MKTWWRARARWRSVIVGPALAAVLVACSDPASPPEAEPPDGGTEAPGDEVTAAVAPECDEVERLVAERPGTTQGDTPGDPPDDDVPEEAGGPQEDAGSDAEDPAGTRPDPIDDGPLPGTRADPVDDGVLPGTTAEPIEDEAVGGGSGGTTADLFEEEPLTDIGRDDGAPPLDAAELAPQIDRWGQEEAADSFAGVWLEPDAGGIAVAFARDVRAHATEVRERFHPGIAVAVATHTYAELRDVQDRVTADEMGAGDLEPGAVTSTGVDVMSNRTTVGVHAPDEARLADLSRTYGATAICFEIQAAAEPPAEGVLTLAKASGWRDDLLDLDPAFAVLEVAYDRGTAEAAWRDNVPDGLAPRDADLPDEPGVYADLDAVDFDRQAVVVWSSGESGSCPEWLADLRVDGATIHVERERAGGVCTDDYNPYRVVVAVDRDRVPEEADLADARLEGVPDGEVRVYPGDED